MKYELAKQLKDAGFPFKPCTEIAVEGTPHVCNNFPTLEELIEACGDNVTLINRNDGKTRYEFNWLAYIIGSTLKALCRTPTEAVANLWLALNKN